MASPAKIGITLLTLGSAGVATYGGITYFSKETETQKQGKSIKSLIDEKFEYVLLDFTAGASNPNEQTWKTKWKAYKTDNKNNNQDILGVKNWSKNTESESTEELKARCKELSETVVYDQGKANYGSVTKYCGRDATAEDEALRQKLKIITGAASDDWASKIAKKEKLTAQLKKLNITETESALTSVAIKPKCETAKVKPRKSDGYAAFYEAYKLICTSHPVT